MSVLHSASRKQKTNPGHFFVAKENGSVLLSCRTTMALGLIKPLARLNYLPPRASLLTITCDHVKTTKPHKPNIHHTKEKQIMRT